MTTNHKPNRLAKEKSPYLLQHQYNPVNWFPWSEEAFEIAKREDKPIFLSIGYSTCHWCHVMERESFEDDEVAALLNEKFISIKVDREERPDVDHIYMNVCQQMTGHGGWPLSILMTPDKKPFFAGTYFPKSSGYGHPGPGIMEVLGQIADKWTEDRERIMNAADKVTEAVQVVYANEQGTEMTMGILHEAFDIYKRSFDPKYGGFGSAPKFPSPHNLCFLMRYHHKTGNQEALDMVKKTLDAMYAGGIYDHLGYGFSRYSVDREWLVPHFEKMLYDNALLAIAYIECYQITGNETYKRVANQIFQYVQRDMTSEEGGFFSAEDADSEGEEGKFYVWTPDEIKQVLGEQNGQLFCDYYDVTKAGNFEGHNILNLVQQDAERFVAGKNMTVKQFEEQLEQMRKKLFEIREKRIHPHKDDKILTAWNGLMVAALSKGAQALGEPKWLQLAEDSVSFIFRKLIREDGRLLARYREGEAAFLAYVDDYAFLIWGLIELYQTNFKTEYLEKALGLHQDMMRLFWDQEHGGFFFYGEDAEQLLSRPKELYDGAMPSGNSVAAVNTLRLARLTGQHPLEETAQQLLETFSGEVSHYPTAFSHFLMAYLFALKGSKEVVIVGEEENASTRSMIEMVHSRFLPDVVTLFKSMTVEGLEKLAPFTQEYRMMDGKTALYICENHSCQAPTTDVNKLTNK